MVDLAQATLKDLVEDFVKLELGYGDKEVSVSNEVGILYDPDETDNLEKKLADLGNFFQTSHPNSLANIVAGQASRLTRS